MISLANLYQTTPQTSALDSDQPGAENIQKMEQLNKEMLDMNLWAASQGLALNKMKLFHAIAKQVNDLQ